MWLGSDSSEEDHYKFHLKGTNGDAYEIIYYKKSDGKMGT